MSLTVVVSTYEWPQALAVVLRALREQQGEPFEVVVADDGSGEQTARVVERWKAELDIVHVWQPNEGFQKARLLNRAVLTATGDHLVFLDGDCIPRTGFTRAMRQAALPGWFAASKRLHLVQGLTRRVIDGGCPVWRWSALEWVVREPLQLVRSPQRQVNRPGVLLPLRDRARPWKPTHSDYRPPYNGYGYAFGVSRRDFERVNGFDMRLRGWDGEDLDVAERLLAAGLRCGWPGPASSVLHLWHAPRKQPSRRLVREPGAVESPLGLRELAEELGADPQVSANRVTGSSSSSDPV